MTMMLYHFSSHLWVLFFSPWVMSFICVNDIQGNFSKNAAYVIIFYNQIFGPALRKWRFFVKLMQ